MKCGTFKTSLFVLCYLISSRVFAQTPLTCFVGIEVSGNLPEPTIRFESRACNNGEVCLRAGIRVDNGTRNGVVAYSACIADGDCSDPKPDIGGTLSLQSYFIENGLRINQSDICEANCCRTEGCNDISNLCANEVLENPSTPRPTSGVPTNADMQTQPISTDKTESSETAEQPNKTTKPTAAPITKVVKATDKPTDMETATPKTKPTQKPITVAVQELTTGSGGQATSNLLVISFAIVLVAFMTAK